MYYFYFDASGLVKRYTEETGSDKVDFLFQNVPYKLNFTSDGRKVRKIPNAII